MLVHKDILYINEFASQICSPCFLINNRTLHSPFNYSASSDIRKYTTLPVSWGSFNWQDKKIVTPKMMFIASSKEIDSIQAKIPQSLREHYNFVRSEPNYLEVMKKCSQGAACQFLAKYLNISSSQIIAIGDEYNDVEMLKYAGLGIAMQNAREEIKAIADWVTLSNDCDGVAYAIEKWILNNE
jgi:Cof subfamily protein (haloacid dehalogenase superfamily)